MRKREHDRLEFGDLRRIGSVDTVFTVKNRDQAQPSMERALLAVSGQDPTRNGAVIEAQYQLKHNGVGRRHIARIPVAGRCRYRDRPEDFAIADLRLFVDLRSRTPFGRKRDFGGPALDRGCLEPDVEAEAAAP